MFDKKEFKQKLDDLRINTPLNVAEQSRLIGVSRPTLERIINENDATPMQESTIRKILHYLKQQESNDNN